MSLRVLHASTTLAKEHYTVLVLTVAQLLTVLIYLRCRCARDSAPDAYTGTMGLLLGAAVMVMVTQLVLTSAGTYDGRVTV